MAAVLACGNGAVLSHYSGAWLWGLTSGCGKSIDVTAVVPRHGQPGIRVHSAKTLAPEDVTVFEDIPVTSVPRILLDLAAVHPRALAWALGRAKRRGLLDLASMDALLKRSKGQRGVARLRLSLSDYREPAFTRSGVERRFLRLVRQAGLPLPRTNLFVAGYELDAYWPEERFAVELDSYEFHGDPKSFEKDRVRHEELKLSGIEIVRFTAARIDAEPALVVERLRRLLIQRRREIQHHAVN